LQEKVKNKYLANNSAINFQEKKFLFLNENVYIASGFKFSFILPSELRDRRIWQV